MIAITIALLGAFVLLPHVSGQHRDLAADLPSKGYPGHFLPRRPVDHSSLRERRIQNKAASPPYYLDCVENPFVKHEKGCPCFSVETIFGFMDLATIAEFCTLNSSTPVRSIDSRSFYPSSGISFTASTRFNNSGTLEFGFGAIDDPFTEGSFMCSSFAGYNRYSMDETGMLPGEYRGYAEDSRSYGLTFSVTHEEFTECVAVLKKVNASLPDDICTIKVLTQNSSHYGGLRKRRIQNEAASPLYFLDCGENPIVEQEQGCPCFSAATISRLMDSAKVAEYCTFNSSSNVNFGIPRTSFSRSAIFSASTTLFNNSGIFAISFEAVAEKADPLMKISRTCSGRVSYESFSDGMLFDNTGVRISRSLDLRVTQEQFRDCVRVLNEINATLPDDICKFTGLGV
jgi:hypothetical protein